MPFLEYTTPDRILAFFECVMSERVCIPPGEISRHPNLRIRGLMKGKVVAREAAVVETLGSVCLWMMLTALTLCVGMIRLCVSAGCYVVPSRIASVQNRESLTLCVRVCVPLAAARHAIMRSPRFQDSSLGVSHTTSRADSVAGIPTYVGNAALHSFSA